MTQTNISFEPDYRFSDKTILEADGMYEEAILIMREEKEPFPWCLRSELTLVHPFGAAEMELEFHSDGRVIIVGFKPSIADPVLNFDIRCLRAWTEANGWKPPEPHQNIIPGALPFWRHMWTIQAVNSEVFDRRYGERQALEDDVAHIKRDDGELDGIEDI
jgi:hypothetical protein